MKQRAQLQWFKPLAAWWWAVAMMGLVTGPLRAAETSPTSLRLGMSWGHGSPQVESFVIQLKATEMAIANLTLHHTEPADNLEGTVVRTRAGAGDIDGLSATLNFAERFIAPITNAQQIWKHLLQHGDPGAAQRLQADPGWRPDPRLLTVQWGEPGSQGFSLTVDQLLTQKAFWFPALDLLVWTGESEPSWESHQRELRQKYGRRVLDRVGDEPEVTYADFASRWEDMGHPTYRNPHSVPPGHIIGLTWDSALNKFGVDRLAEVRNDYGKQDVFQFRLAVPDASQNWREQRLEDGLPIVATVFEHDGVRQTVEQFAFPLLGPPKERRGDIAMVLLQKFTLQELAGRSRTVALDMQLTREGPGAAQLRAEANAFVLGTESVAWLAVQGATALKKLPDQGKQATLRAEVELPSRGRRELIVKLPSPVVPGSEMARLLGLDYSGARAETVRFWEEYLRRGASFKVPDPAVNTLFRANLWHALRLPRRHGASGPEVTIDLPYSNFAYDQKGTPWPVNQAVYVDYMLFDLRGYHAIAAEELATIYRNNQEPNGHVGGFANWGVYTPSMIYSVAQHFLLSGDRASLERLLPQTLRALEWCLAEVNRPPLDHPTPGLMLAPLNDLTHEPRSWAFNQAYLVAAFDMLGRALAAIQHPRATDCEQAARALRAAVAREYARAAIRAPAVQLADGSWSPYVPTDAQASGRLFQVWYPTDVDVGPLHLLRLKALDARGWLATAMLHDHEDNLFIHQWGTINEPVYNMQGTAYLLRDEPKAAIRTFYSTMACAFSHSVFEPVEHRWGWGQYFGPPSTDGSWFELYRNMMVCERDDDTLMLCQATPRAWLAPGKRIEVERAPTYFGPVSFALQGGTEQLSMDIDLNARSRPAAVLVRFRHPQQRPITSVTVNGQAWKDWDANQEWVRIASPTESRYRIVTSHQL